MKPIVVFRHVRHESLGALEPLIERAGLEFQYVDLFEQFPRDFDPRQYAGLIILGGPMNVDETERYPFLAAEIPWIQAALAAQLPTLGICLGSQLLAKAAGEPVYPNPVKEIGWYTVSFTPAAGDDLLFNQATNTTPTTVFQWHGDTFDRPHGAVLLARSELCPVQAFRLEPCAWGLQFHVEVSPAMIESWLVEPTNCAELAGLQQIDADQIRRDIPERYPALQQLAEKLLTPFVELCRQLQGTDWRVRPIRPTLKSISP